MIRTAALLRALALLVVLAAPSLAQTAAPRAAGLPAYRFRLLGVYDERTGEPVEGADVVHLADGVGVATSVTGTVALSHVPDGGGIIRIRKLGYELHTMVVEIGPSDTLPVTVTLSRLVTLDTVRAVARGTSARAAGLRAFEERRLTGDGAGHFVSDSVLRASDGQTLRTVVPARVAGLALQAGRTGASHLVSSRKVCRGTTFSACAAPNCYVTVYLDGVLLYSGRSNAPPLDVSRIQASDLSGIEYYPGTGTAPAQFNGTDAGCGVLLLWSRER